MSLKGFTSSFNAIKSAYNSTIEQLGQVYATMQFLGAGMIGLHTAPRWLSEVSSGNTIDASGHTKRVLSITGHGHRQYDIIRFTSGDNNGIEVQIVNVSDDDTVLLGQELPNTPGNADGYSLLRPMSPTLSATGDIAVVDGGTSVVDFMDTAPFVPSSGGDGIIPRSSSNAIEIVNSLAAAVTKIHFVSDVGAFMNLYSDAARTNLICHLPLTPDEIVDVNIAAGTTLYLGAVKDVDIDDANSIIQMNFIG